MVTIVNAKINAKIENPYWAEVQTFPDSKLWSRKGLFQPESYPDLRNYLHNDPRRLLDPKNLERRSRKALVSKYAWAIPSDKTIIWLGQRLVGRQVVEVGAGRGYWAWLLEQIGIEVICYDNALISLGEENPYFKNCGEHTYHDVLRGDAQAVALHSDKVLFLCWPNYDSSFAVDTLRAYQGDTLVYIGEGDGGCCANDDFFYLLETDWEEIDCNDMIQWEGIHDYCWIYRRKTTPVIQEEP